MSRGGDLDRALRILFDTYWSSAGWKRQPNTPSADLAFARGAGVMFEPTTLDHDQEVQRVIQARARVDARHVADAFIASLGSRRLELRSALGSYAVARHFPAHRFTAGPSSNTCIICGRISDAAQTHDLSVLSFERFKWGGVRHTSPMFIAFDLEQFAQSVAAEPTVEDRSTLSRIFTSFESLPKDSKLSAVEKSLAGVIKGNSYERRELLAVLGYAGVLQPTSRSGFFESFTDWADREARPLNKDDWPYPIRWWTPKDGVDRRAREFWFPTAAASGSNR